MKKISLLLLSCLAILFLSFASQDEWQIFGEKPINLSLEFDEFVPDEDNNTFSTIKLKVLTEPVYLHNISVLYESGAQTLFVVKKKIKAGNETDSFSIPEKDDAIKKIKMLYKTNTKAESKATIVFLGK